MSSQDRDDTALMLRAVSAVQDATSLDEAVHALVAVLQPRLELWHASLVSLPAAAGLVRIVASWSRTDSAFVTGTEVSTTITPALQRLLEDLLEGEVAMMVIGTGPESLVDHLMREQGVVTAVGVPVLHDGQGLLFLVLGSGVDGPIEAAGAGFFHGLAAGIRDRIGRLAASPAC
jgi:hypothetical protein